MNLERLLNFIWAQIGEFNETEEDIICFQENWDLKGKNCTLHNGAQVKVDYSRLPESKSLLPCLLTLVMLSKQEALSNLYSCASYNLNKIGTQCVCIFGTVKFRK